jgi:hypothetical protein
MEGVLPRPALGYTDEVATAIYRIFGLAADASFAAVSHRISAAS